MRQISFVFLWLLILIMPWEEMFAIPGLATMAKILGVFAFLFGLTSVVISGRVKFPLALVWLALFIGWCLASTQWALDPEAPLERAQTYVLLLTFVWLVCQLADNPKRLKSLMRAFVLGMVILLANMYLGYIGAGVPINSGDDEVRYTAVSANHNDLAIFCCLGILFAFYLITRREKTGFELPNWFYWGYIVAASLAIPLTGSRAGVVSGGIAGLVLLGRLRKVDWSIRLGFVVAVVFVAILVPRLVDRSTLDRIGEGTSSDTYKLRTNAWEYGLKAWAETPLVGVGAGCYRNTMVKQGQRKMVAHNAFVSVLVETGLVGFTLYFLFWTIVIRRAMLLPKADKYFWLGLLASFLPALLTGSTEYQKVWWFLGALVLCQTPQPSAADAKKRWIAPSLDRGPGLPLLSRRSHQP